MARLHGRLELSGDLAFALYRIASMTAVGFYFYLMQRIP